MSFTNTIDQLGDKVTLSKIVDGSLTEYYDDTLKTIGAYGLYRNETIEIINCPEVTEITTAFLMCTKLHTAIFPKLKKIKEGIQNCTALTNVCFPELEEVGMHSLIGGGLKTVDIGRATKIVNGSFNYTYSLIALIMRSESIVNLASTNFSNSHHIVGSTNATYNPDGAKDGYFYVPRALLDDTDSTKDYRQATNWSTYATQFRALEDWTVDGTITGELDWDKINAA